jgi:hypothetical protein
VKARVFSLAALVAGGLGLAAAQAPAANAAQRLDVSARVHLLPGGGATLRQSGSFTGTPFGRGTLSVSTQVGVGRGARVSFVMRSGRGTVRGASNVGVRFRGAVVIYSGQARITGGSGAFRRLRGRKLHFSGSGDLMGSSFGVHMNG